MNKIIKVITTVLLLFFVITSLNASDRIWKNYSEDDGTIHSLGNGKMCVYEQGPNITTVFSSPFSAPSLYSFSLDMMQHVESRSTRTIGTAIWSHNILVEGKEVCHITDLVDAEIPCLIRKFNSDIPIQFKMKFERDVSIIDNKDILKSKGMDGGFMLSAHSGTAIYQSYVWPQPMYNQIAWKGDIQVIQKDPDSKEVEIIIGSGDCLFFFIGGPSYPEVVKNTETISNLSWEKSFQRTEAYWNEFTNRRIDFESEFAKNLPQREKLLRTIDEVSVMIKTQQSIEGAVVAGYPYPLGYVRDQFGVSRALLALGYNEEARAILNFYWNVWKKHGKVQNAQGIGIDGIFHIHENDEVESPGYLIIQAFDLFEKTSDTEFIQQIFPMLEWCWEVQKKHLVKGMLPFNGDETYVAGGILPRSALNDGSAESTLLFIDGGIKLLTWIEENELWPKKVLNENYSILNSTKDLFRTNFFQKDRMITNNPIRTDFIDLPRFRHGVCERFMENENCLMHTLPGICWTEKNENNRYLCAECITLDSYPAAEPHVYDLISVSMTPIYFHSQLFKTKEFISVVKEVFKDYQKSGSLSHVEDIAEKNLEIRTVGYDYGLLLYAMSATNHNKSYELYNKTLSIVDPIGSWSEYYINHKPQGTRCRPWESAMNLEALIHYAQKFKN